MSLLLLVLWSCAEGAKPTPASSGHGGDGAEGAEGGDETGQPSGGDSGQDSGGLPQDWPLYINEAMPANDSYPFTGGPEGVDPWTPDWVELYNPAPYEVELTGFVLSDSLEAPESGHRLGGLILPAQGRLLLYADSGSVIGPQHLSFALSSDGEELGLFGPEGQPLDQIRWGLVHDDFAAARMPDGGDLALTSAVTPDAPNPASEED